MAKVRLTQDEVKKKEASISFGQSSRTVAGIIPPGFIYRLGYCIYGSGCLKVTYIMRVGKNIIETHTQLEHLLLSIMKLLFCTNLQNFK